MISYSELGQNRVGASVARLVGPITNQLCNYPVDARASLFGMG